MTPGFPWWAFALMSAGFAGATAILAKVGVQGVPSNLATALRTVVILVFTWAIVLASGEQRAISQLNARSLVFLGLSAITTALSWLTYFRALQLGPASQVAPIDKLSVAIAVILAWAFLGESVTPRTVTGVVLIIGGTLLCLK